MKKKIFLVLVVLIILVLGGLFGYLVYNSFTIKSQQMQVEALPLVKIDSVASSQRLSQAIQFQTVSTAQNTETKTAEFQKFHQFLETSFPKTQAGLTKETIGNHSLLYTWKGSDANLKPIILMAHQDVVPIDESTKGQWTHQPFSGDIADGFIWGRGTLDDKQNLLGIFESIELLLNENFQPKRTIYLVFGHDEEIGGKTGAVEIVKILKDRNIQAEFILDEGGSMTDKIVKGIDPPVALIGIAEKGYLSLELTVEDAGGHSSQPPQHTAIGVLSKAITKLEDNPLPGGLRGISAQMFEKLTPEMNFSQKIFLSNLWLFKPIVEHQLSTVPSTNAALRTTTAVTVFNSGVKDNVLPNKATALVNFRLLPGDTTESVTEFVRQTIADERVKIANYGENVWNPSVVSDTNSPNFQNLEKTIRQTFPDAVVAPYLMLGATDSRHFSAISPNIYKFSPTKINAEDLPRIHGINERISIESYTNGIGFYYNLVKSQ